jgi:uncharacterized protein CbrC (UPF0167 family)
MALLLSEALVRHTHWTVEPIEHLAKFNWHLQTCNNCIECRSPSGEAARRKTRCLHAASQALLS